MIWGGASKCLTFFSERIINHGSERLTSNQICLEHFFFCMALGFWVFFFGFVWSTLMCILALFSKLSVVCLVLSGPKGTSFFSCSKYSRSLARLQTHKHKGESADIHQQKSEKAPTQTDCRELIPYVPEGQKQILFLLPSWVSYSPLMMENWVLHDLGWCFAGLVSLVTLRIVCEKLHVERVEGNQEFCWLHMFKSVAEAPANHVLNPCESFPTLPSSLFNFKLNYFLSYHKFQWINSLNPMLFNSEQRDLREIFRSAEWTEIWQQGPFQTPLQFLYMNKWLRISLINRTRYGDSENSSSSFSLSRS